MDSATERKVSVAETITLHVRIVDCRVRVVFSIVRSLAVEALSATSLIDRIVKGIFPHPSPERKIDPYNFKPLPILAVSEKPKEPKENDTDKAQHAEVI